MSGPVPSPSMKAMIGWSGTWSLPWLMVTFSPAGILIFMSCLRVGRTLGLLAPRPRRVFALRAPRSAGLAQGIQGRARLEPADLLVGHRVGAGDRYRLAPRLVDHHLDGLAGRERAEPAHADAVALLEQVVV